MAVINADTGNFVAKLAMLRSGDTLQLAAGNYGSLNLAHRNFAAMTTIKGGTFASVAVGDCSNLTFDATTVNLKPTATSTINAVGMFFNGVHDVLVTNAKVTGGLAVNGVPQSALAGDATGNVIGLPTGKGIVFNYSNNCAISHSELSLFARAVTFAASNNITITGNDIHDVRSDGIEGSVGSGLVISGNHIHASHSWMVVDHPDKIHIWTEKTAMTGVVITGNVLEQGDGGWSQSISLDDNLKGLGFKDVVIKGNIITAQGSAGIGVENTSGTISDNVLTWSGKGDGYTDKPRFQIADGSNHLVFDGNTGDVAIYARANNLAFSSHNGNFSETADLSAADRATISIEAVAITGSASYTLNATTTDLKFAGTGDFFGIGNALANHITGGKGNDTLVGSGGADVLDGGWGDDTYVVDNSQQTIIDSMGIDTVKSSISWTLQSGLENLIYTGSGDAVLTGNNAANHIVGGPGNDTLTGGGGADVLDGGLGNDTYVVSNGSQTIMDSGGVDTVVSSIAWTLQAGLERLTLSGSANVSATGNAADNILHGNSGSNLIDGGAGADIMYGGAGNDTYVVDNVGDRATEVEGGIDSGGIDQVKCSAASFTLDTGIENLTYTGASNFVGTGNALANVLTGGEGSDFLYGKSGADVLSGGAGSDTLDGGAGADKLTGGSGNDIFVLARGEADGDFITDFMGNGSAPGDMIKLAGWGAGTTITKVTGGSMWSITDGVDHHVETVTINGAVHVSDILFG